MKQNINFKKAYRRQQEKNRPKKPLAQRLAGPVLACTAAVTIVACGVIKFQQYQLKEKAVAVSAQIQTSDRTKLYEERMRIQSQYSALKAKNDDLENKENLLKTRPALTSGAYEALMAPAPSGMRIERISYTEDGLLAAVFCTGDPSLVPGYVDAVEASGFFLSVGYSGWYAEDGYHFQIGALLREETTL